MTFRDKEIEELCKKLKPVIGKNAEKLWYSYLAEDFKGRSDIGLDIEIMSEKILKKEALKKQKILLEPPDVKSSEGQIYLGELFYNQKGYHPLFLMPTDFIKQIGIFAVTGEGKTNLAYLLALQLLKLKIPFMVIDWKRSWRNLLSLKGKVKELENLNIYTIGRKTNPFPWNPFRAPPNSDEQLWISAIAETLERSHLSGPGVAYYFNKIYIRLLKEFQNGFCPNFFDGLRELEKIRAFERELKWKQTALRIFQSFTIGNASKDFNSRDPIKIENILDKPIILELDLEMPKALRIFFSEIILKWIHLYRLSQGETEKLRHVLFLEEAHNLFGSTGGYQSYWANNQNSLENIYREIRAFGQGIVSITQHPSLLPIYLLGNCHTQIYLGLQHEDDIRAARKALFLKPEEEFYLNSLKIGESIIKIKDRIDPCLVKIPLVPVKKGLITDNWLRVNIPTYLPSFNKGQILKAPTYLPKDNNIGIKNGKIQKNYQLLIDIFEYPLSSTTERYSRLKLNPKYGNKYKNMLISKGYIQPRKIIHCKGRLTLFDITRKGKALLRDFGFDAKDFTEGIVHRFWKYRIAEYYQNLGYKVEIEEQINGRPDIIVKSGKKKVAVEIETGKSNPFENIQRNLRAGFDEVICVATEKIIEDKIREEIKLKGIADERVKITSVMGFDY